MAAAATTTASASHLQYGSKNAFRQARLDSGPQSSTTVSATLRLHHPNNACRSRLLLLRGAHQSRLPTGNGFRGHAARVKRLNVKLIVVCELEPCLGDSPVVRESVDTNVAVSHVGGDVDVGKSGGAESGVSVPPVVEDGGGYGSGDDGKFPSGGGGGGRGGRGGGGHNEEFDEEAAEFGPLLKFEEVLRETKSRGVILPPDMFEAAKFVGIRQVILENYFNLQGAAWPLGYAIKSWSFLRNRMLVDHHFLFKIGTEIVIDSCCATFAEIHKRGKDFWSEFELYAADLLVGVVVNVALVGMLAPYARIGQPTTTNGIFGRLRHAYGALPSSVFEAERPGCKFTIQQRVATYFYKGIMYGVVGFTCGLIGQGIANMIMMAKRNVRKSEEDIPVPPLVKSAALWGAFLGVSSNTRYQIINGLERVVEESSVAKRLPLIAMGFTVSIRLSNNIYGGMQFVDWARWSGCQ